MEEPTRVTVREAATRLNVSEATVTRRLRLGQLKGEKVGRDWQVDEDALPERGDRSGRGEAIPFSRAELKQALRYVKGTDLNELWVPDILRWQDYLANPDDLIDNVESSIDQLTFGHAAEVLVPKNSIFSRPALMISLEDRIAFQAAVSRIAKGIERLTSDRVYSARLSSRDDYFLNKSPAAYGKWAKMVHSRLDDVQDGWLVETDLTAYFDTVDQSVLARELVEHDLDNASVDVIQRQLRHWSPLKGRGLIQGPNAARVLGNFYLLPVDRRMMELGYDYWRYMDDIRVIAPTRAKAVRAVRDLEGLCRARGLVVGAAKTRILSGQEAATVSDNSARDQAQYLFAAHHENARKALREIFGRAFKAGNDVDVGNATFALWRLALLLDKSPLARVLNRIADLGPIASVSAAYLRRFLTEPRTAEAMTSYLHDLEANTSSFLETWLFATMLEHPGNLPQGWIDRARSVSRDRNMDPYHRSIAFNVLALGRKNSDIEYLKRELSHEYSPLLSRAIVTSLARVSRLDKDSIGLAVSRVPRLSNTVNYLAGRRRLPSLVYRGTTVPVRRSR